jgi:hypothetical protein
MFYTVEHVLHIQLHCQQRTLILLPAITLSISAVEITFKLEETKKHWQHTHKISSNRMREYAILGLLLKLHNKIICSD